MQSKSFFLSDQHPREQHDECSVKINLFKTNVAVAANHVKIRYGLISRNLKFMFRYSNSEVEKKWTPSLPNNMKLLGLQSIFILDVKKESDKGAPVNSSGNSS